MNDAIVATYDGYNAKDRNGQRPPKYSADHTLYLINTMGGAESQPFLESHADRQIREDKGFYIPDFLSDEQHDTNPEAFTAATDHAKHLVEAERLLGEVLNLVGLLLTSLSDEGDSRAMQIDTALRVIEKKLSKACNGIDKHDTRHTNLFLAYFDLKGKADEGEQN